MRCIPNYLDPELVHDFPLFQGDSAGGRRCLSERINAASSGTVLGNRIPLEHAEIRHSTHNEAKRQLLIGEDQ